MGRGVNRVFLIGNLGKDPEVRHFPSGDAYCNVSVATSESWTDKQTGEKKERTEWHNVVFTRKLAEIVGEYLHKGSKVYVEGSLRTRKWERDGVDHYTTEVIVNDLQMLDGKPQDGGSQGRQGGGSRNSEGRSGSGGYSRTSNQQHTRPQQQPAPMDDHGFSDDDIPFS